MKIKEYYKEKQYIHYSNCHEDAAFLLQAAGRPKKILSVASALDNSLALLLLDPDEVLAIDSNPAQIYLCNLKKCAVKHLSYREFLIFSGVREGDSTQYYEKIKNFLDGETRGYFDRHLYLIEQIKLVNAGRFEYYFRIFANRVMPKIVPRKTVEKFMSAETVKEQKEIYRTEFNTLRFRLMFRVFFSEWVMKRLGRDKNYFAYNQGSLSAFLRQKFEQGIGDNLNRDNPYLQYVLFNRFISLPLYLQEENFPIIKENIEKLTLKQVRFQEEIERGEKYDFMNLSDIFEYMGKEEMRQLEKPVSDSLSDGGKIVYWNMMNERYFNGELVSERLDQTHDRAFYYTACYLSRKR